MPQIIREFITYIVAIKGHSKKTADEYAFDLRMFFRFLKLHRNIVPKATDFDDIQIDDVDIPFVGSVTITEIYEYLAFLMNDREKTVGRKKGLGAAARARKVSSLKTFYKYLTEKVHKIENNPTKALDAPKVGKTLPKHLTVNESLTLLGSVSGKFEARDKCMLTLFLNCGLRVSELASISIEDIREDTLRIIGKGNKERVVYLNESCIKSIADWLDIRKTLVLQNEAALFISKNRTRLAVPSIKWLVKKHLGNADLNGYSTHKLRHTAATLMYQNGVDVLTLQELLGHENLNTTKIYTHVNNENLRNATKVNPLNKT